MIATSTLKRYFFMHKFTKFALAAAFASIASISGAQTAQPTKTVDNWRSSEGQVWRSADGLCWRNANWTSATAAVNCDGQAVARPVIPAPVPYVAPVVVPVAPPVVAPVVVPAPVAKPAPAIQPMPAPAPVKAAPAKFTISGDAMFDTDKAFIKPAGKASLDEMIAKLARSEATSVESVVVIGHTDSAGGDMYNDKLSLRRARAVQSYLILKGFDPNRISVEGRGERNPIASNATAAGRAQNRRVEVEVTAVSRN